MARASTTLPRREAGRRHEFLTTLRVSAIDSRKTAVRARFSAAATPARAVLWLRPASPDSGAHRLPFTCSLSLGVPVVASRAGGNPELLREGEDGLLVAAGDPERLADALVALATDSDLLNSLTARAIAGRRRFDSVEVARRAAAVLRSAVGEAAPSHEARQPLRTAACEATASLENPEPAFGRP